MILRARSVLLLGFALLVTAAVFAGPALATPENSIDGQKLVVAKQDRRLYVNTETLASPAEGVVSFWDKVVPRPGSKYHRKIQRTLRDAGHDYRELAYFQTLTEVDCVRNIHRDVTTVYYDRNDRVVLATGTKDSEWHRILPQQKETLLRDEICGQYIPVASMAQLATVSMGCPEIY